MAVDWIAVRKFVDPEPSHGSWGSEETTYTLTIASVEHGTTDPEAGEYQYEENSEVEVEAFPDEGFQFDKWIYDTTESEDNPVTVKMDKDITITGYFKEISIPVSPIGKRKRILQYEEQKIKIKIIPLTILEAVELFSKFNYYIVFREKSLALTIIFNNKFISKMEYQTKILKPINITIMGISVPIKPLTPKEKIYKAMMDLLDKIPI